MNLEDGMLTIQEIEMLAGLLLRTGVNQIEIAWINTILERLRASALEQQAKAALEAQTKSTPEQPTEEEKDN